MRLIRYFLKDANTQQSFSQMLPDSIDVNDTIILKQDSFLLNTSGVYKVIDRDEEDVIDIEIKKEK